MYCAYCRAAWDGPMPAECPECHHPLAVLLDVPGISRVMAAVVARSGAPEMFLAAPAWDGMIGVYHSGDGVLLFGADGPAADGESVKGRFSSDTGRWEKVES
jgi:hypothetical protein